MLKRFGGPGRLCLLQQVRFTVDSSKAEKSAVATETANGLLDRLIENPGKLEKLIALIG